MYKNCVILKVQYNTFNLTPMGPCSYQIIEYSDYQVLYYIYIFIEIFLGRQPCQDVRFFRFRDRLCPNLQVVAGGLVETKLMTYMYIDLSSYR